MSIKDENNAIKLALQERLKYKDSSSFVSLNGDAPNSCTILDKKTSLVWKVARNRASANPYLELRALESLPDDIECVVKHTEAGSLTVGGVPYFYFTFPFIKGTPLGKLIYEHKKAGRTFTTSEIRKVAECISQAIAVLNDKGIVHQDIKPDNIIVKSDGSAVLIDLGIALFIQDAPKKLKKLEGPYAYMSPEKLAVVVNAKFRQWAKLNFSSDLFSLGLILLEMATLKRVTGELEPEIGQLDKVYELIPGLSIDEDVKQVITPYLLPLQYDRQQQLAQMFGIQWITPTEKGDHRLWLHSDSFSASLYESFLQEYSFKSPFGLIYKAEQATSEKNIAEIKKRGQGFINKGGKFALDPSTYLQVFDEDHHRGTEHFSYQGILDLGQIISPPQFAPEGYVQGYVKNVVDSQVELGTSIIISPYLYLDRIESKETEANFRLWQVTNEYTSSNEAFNSIPVYYGLIASENLIKSRDELKELAQVVANQRYAKNIYLRIESKRPQSQPVSDRVYLENLRLFLDYISQNANVLLANTGVDGIGFLSLGVNEISTNPSFSQRKFSLEDKLSDRTGGSQPDPRYFVKNLMNEVLVQQEMNNPRISSTPELKAIFTCTCSNCPKRDKESLAKHYMVIMDEIFHDMTRESDLQKRKNKFCGLLDHATTLYGILAQKNIQFTVATGGTFLPIWKQVFSR